jgi:hypothetical protein
MTARDFNAFGQVASRARAAVFCSAVSSQQHHSRDNQTRCVWCQTDKTSRMRSNSHRQSIDRFEFNLVRLSAMRTLTRNA